MSMKKLALVIAALGLLTVSASGAFAQKGKDGGKPKVKVYDFSGDTIEGDLIKPEGDAVDARDITQFSSLIRIRKDFIAEIIKAAEDL
jgi:hypothetical protein